MGSGVTLNEFISEMYAAQKIISNIVPKNCHCWKIHLDEDGRVSICIWNPKANIFITDTLEELIDEVIKELVIH